MIYLLKFFIRLALSIFCKEVHVKNKHLLDTKGPLFIIANHPNSFLDAIIIGAYYNRSVYFLARGDVFEKKIYRFFLNALNMIPVYRLREGKAFLHLNDYSIKKSIQLISKGAAVLIFIEGICINSNELQPFKKGTARILEGIQKLNVHLKIHIAGIAFNQFRGIGKTVNLDISEMNNIPLIQNNKDRVVFNQIVFEQLKQNIQIPTTPTKFNTNNLFYKIHLPFYNLIKNFVAEKTKDTVFFDSVLFTVLLFTYPLFIISLFFILNIFHLPTTIILVILVSLPIMGKRVQE